MKRISVLCLVCLVATVASAEDEVHPFISSKFSLQAGAFFPSKNFDIRVDGTLTGENEQIDFDESLGLGGSDNIFALEFKWRFGEKWSTRLQYFGSDQEGKAVLEDDIQWGDETILAGSSVTAGTSFDLTRVFVGRSFESSEKVDFGAGFGVHFLEIGAFIKEDLITTFGEKSSVSVSGPLPNIGAWYYYSPSPKWFVGGRIDWLQVSVGKYDGGITNFAVGVNYQMFQNIGIGVKYQLFRLGVDVDDDTWHGRAVLNYDGAIVYLSANW